MPISTELSPSFCTVWLVASATSTAFFAIFAASLAHFAISRIDASISSELVATTVRFFDTCSDAADTTPVCVAVSSAFAAICSLIEESSSADAPTCCALFADRPDRLAQVGDHRVDARLDRGVVARVVPLHLGPQVLLRHLRQHHRRLVHRLDHRVQRLVDALHDLPEVALVLGRVGPGRQPAVHRRLAPACRRRPPAR